MNKLKINNIIKLIFLILLNEICKIFKYEYIKNENLN